MGKKLLVFCGGHLMGGVEIVTLNYLKELNKLGIQIHCITNACGNGEFDKRLLELEIPHTSVKLGFIYPRKPLWTLDTLWNFPSALKKVKEVIASFQPVVFYHTSFRTIYMLQYFLKTKHHYHVHDNITANLFNKHILNSIKNRTNKFIAVSNTTKRYLMTCGVDASKIEVLYNGTTINPPLKHKNHSLLTLGIVGQIIPRKGHELLVDALHILSKKNIQVKLKIFGSGSDFFIDFLKAKITDYGLTHEVEWMGFYSNLDKVYQHIDVLVLPTLDEEPFGMGIIEAGVRNVPVLASDVGGPAEILKHNFNGWLFEGSSLVDFVEKLEQIAHGDVDLIQLANNNYAKISTEFDICIQAEQLNSILSID